MQKYRITVQYAGTRYSGWQIQKNQDTVQGQLKQALHRLSGETMSVVGAGRTDSGVHAYGQVAHFRLSNRMLPGKLLQALNGLLPWDIRVTRVQLAHPHFHCQKDAVKKRYEYRIYNGRPLSPFLHGYVYHIPPPLDVPAMQEAARHLCGSNDFSAFAASSTGVRTRTRTILVSRVGKKGRHICYQVEADGFLHHMVRNIAGTLIEVGLKKRCAEDMIRILRSRDRRTAGPTAPAHGLYLMRVWY